MLERNFRNNLRKEHLGPESRCSDARHPQDGSAAPSEVSIPLSSRTQGTTARLAPLTPRGQVNTNPRVSIWISAQRLKSAFLHPLVLQIND